MNHGQTRRHVERHFLSRLRSRRFRLVLLLSLFFGLAWLLVVEKRRDTHPFDKLRRGMTYHEVVTKIGQPAMVVPDGETQDWFYAGPVNGRLRFLRGRLNQAGKGGLREEP